MTLKNLVLFFMLVCSHFILAQDTISKKLQEIIVSDVYLKKYSSSQNIQKIAIKTIQDNKASLTSLLNQNTLIYFKENGLGMVSSPSFRGTTAQQTAVVWNGININSQLNGQVDFNTISTKNFQNIAIRAGGGSAIYGSSAIGGTIHLNNEMAFNSKNNSQFQLEYGSFNTLGIHLNSNLNFNKTTLQIGFSRNSSDNDYKISKTNTFNKNGIFYNNSFNISLGYQLKKNHILKFYSQLFDAERQLSPSISSVSKSKYQNLDTRNLLELKSKLNKVTSVLRLAQLGEKYQYFENKLSPNFSLGQAETSIIKYDISLEIANKMNLNAIVDYTNSKGSGTDLQTKTRKIGGTALLLSHELKNWFLYEIAVRKETTNQYKSPLLLSVGTVFKPFNFYNIKLNGSRNFRIPSFNDLYWKGSGNPNLRPENSYQAEITNEIYNKNISFRITAFGIKIKDLLRWKPNISGVWSPENVENVTTYGSEMVFNIKKKVNNHLFVFSTSYGFTKSINQKTQKELIYVPNYKWVSNINYSYKKFSLNNQFLYNGQVFTSSDNLNFLSDYLVVNTGINLAIGNKRNMSVGIQANNILNEKYQSVLGRYMPEQNFLMQLNFNI